jgi:dynein heavy chain
MKQFEAYNELRAMIAEWMESEPLLTRLTSDAIKYRHWLKVQSLLTLPPSSDAVASGSSSSSSNTTTDNHNNAIDEIDLDTLEVGQLFDANFLDCKEEIDEVCYNAVKENEIQLKFTAVQDAWTNELFRFGTHRMRENTRLDPKHMTQLTDKLEETQMVLNALMNTRYNAFFRLDLLDWVKRLAQVREIVELWLAVQSSWMYLEAVFASGDVARQLPNEAKRFNAIDKAWVKVMYQVASSPNALYVCCKDQQLRTSLPWMLQSLETCQKFLVTYLEAKRRAFPRFYFISDAVLLDILGTLHPSFFCLIVIVAVVVVVVVVAVVVALWLLLFLLFAACRVCLLGRFVCALCIRSFF